MVQHADIDHTGLTGISSGAVATDAIWDAAGDLAVGSGANTAAKLTLGATNGMALQRVSGAVAWALPPGYEFDYVQFTSDVNITATSEATANTVVTASAVTYDGSTVAVITFWCPAAEPAAGNHNLSFALYDGSSSIGVFALIVAPDASNTARHPVTLHHRLTPSAAAHTYSVRAFVDSGTGIVRSGSGGSGARLPAFIRQVKV